ncbi:hypothetical protein EB821_04840 [Candidatus Marinimicrobia bacterium PRS2]|nr:hypothetical protein EB821_04840 [Candidatus Marinimicrobia bacterium PRS2]
MLPPKEAKNDATPTAINSSLICSIGEPQLIKYVIIQPINKPMRPDIAALIIEILFFNFISLFSFRKGQQN